MKYRVFARSFLGILNLHYHHGTRWQTPQLIYDGRCHIMFELSGGREIWNGNKLLSLRWTSSCFANPEYEPEDMLKAALHTLASYVRTQPPFMVVLILPVWDDTPWNSAAVRCYGNMLAIIYIPAGHMSFIPAHT